MTYVVELITRLKTRLDKGGCEGSELVHVIDAIALASIIYSTGEAEREREREELAPRGQLLLWDDCIFR